MKTFSGKSHDYRDIVFEKLRFRNAYRPQENEKPAFWNSSSSKSVFEKLRFCDGLAWTIGLTWEIKPRFQIFRGLKENSATLNNHELESIVL